MLPQVADDRLFVTDAGMETDLIFNRGVDLPEFAAFVLIDDADGLRALDDYYDGFVAIAREHDAGLILSAPTWRANRDWGARLGYDRDALRDVNKRWMDYLGRLRERADLTAPTLLDGLVGPRGDGYAPGEQMTADEAAEYHHDQLATFAETDADMASALTLNYVDEAVGIARAAAVQGVPMVISFTVETDGCLPTGQTLREAVEEVDAETEGSVAYFMVNCAHPAHFEGALTSGPWLERIRGIRANASAMSHAELDAAEELDAGDPEDLSDGYVRLSRRLPNLNVVGGCCGTDRTHVAAIAARFSGT